MLCFALANMVLSAKGPAKLWLWISIFCSWSHVGIASLHAMMPSPAPIPQFTSHTGQVCSTWGNYHFKTFNGDIYYFPGTCNYLFASHCTSNNEDFNIQIRRSVENGVPIISNITAILDGVVVEIRNKIIMLDGVLVTEIPAEKSRVHVNRLGNNLKITASTDISLIWNGEDSLLLKLNRNKYANKTCGMCGDFSGVRGFTIDGEQLTPVQHGNIQKRNGPTEECLDVPSFSSNDCKDESEICKSILTSAALYSCNTILEPMDYIDACVQDLCRCSTENMPCLCSMFSEYSRQCTHSGGTPGNWRTSEMCPQSCPINMVYQECGSPCPNTCSNTERTMLCEDHCIDGCICPSGTVLDDINNTGCIPQEECSCVYNSETYTPGSSFNTPCRECTCARGKWKCKELPCTGSCSVEGGSHITSFDGSRYNINGDCSYVLAKHNTANDFTVLVELRRCGITNNKSCLKSVVLGLQKGETVLVIKDNGVVFLNWIPVQLPISVANMTIFWSTSFYMNIHTNFDVEIQVQHIPIMQVYVTLGPSYLDQTHGLCGNFNNIQSDDFKAISGVSEGTAAGFANTWKSNSNCPNIKNSFEDPCSLNLEKEKYAQHWCDLLTSPNGPFSSCHSIENPLTYYTNCLSDTCSCEDSEECMCAALASYAYACAKKSVTLNGWRDNVCEKYIKSCKESQVYQYNVSSCQPTCRSRSNDDTTFNFKISPVDGCVCKEGTYLNDNGDCVVSSSCPCYYQGNVMESGELVEENGITCTCERGELTCMGAVIKVPVCLSPLVYHNCSSAPKGTKGVECQKSCHTLDMDCFSSQCVSGCVCPQGLVSDGKGGCISEQQCPCIHNEATYRPGDSISVGCNTCTCKNRRWQCTHKPCLGTCSVYGDGHYITFDNKQFTFSGSCEYILAQDNCGENEGQSSFRVITENVACGRTGTTCSKNIKFFIGGKELRLDNEKIEVVKREHKKNIPYNVIRRGIYLIIKTENGILLMWDKKTTIHIKLAANFKGNVCGICGNYDDKESNDFTTRSQSVVENLIEFGNSWKTDPNCPNVHIVNDPCSMNPYRKAWALRQCGIITSEVFQRCHAQVDPRKYYESCISDSCACDTGGDCECFCTTVALYAQACSENGVCINWRTPNICPMFCDYYNEVGECEWHYKPCGDKCMKTCKNPKGECLHELSGCEGCYPKCPPSRPYLNEDTMKCVAQCGCVDESGMYYNYGDKVNSSRNCDSCVCSMEEGIVCQYNASACVCEHKGKQYEYDAIIPNDNANCTEIKCGEKGQIVTITKICTTIYADSQEQSTTTGTTTVTESSATNISASITPPSTSSTGITTTTATSILVTTSSKHTTSKHSTIFSTTNPCKNCHWSEWIDKNRPTSDNDGGDQENFETAEAIGIKVCGDNEFIRDILCRAPSFPNTPFELLDQRVSCNKNTVICRNIDNPGKDNKCFHYKVRFLCCEEIDCFIDEPTPTTSLVPSNQTSISSRITNKVTTGNPSTSTFSSGSTHFPLPSFSTTIESTKRVPTTSIQNTNSQTTKTMNPPSSGTAPLSSTTATSIVTSSQSLGTSNSHSTKVTTASTITNSLETTNSIHSTSDHISSSTTVTSSTPCEECHWSHWIDVNHPTSDSNGGDVENFETTEAAGIKVCSHKKFIAKTQCRSTLYPNTPIEELGQKVTCNKETGLICRNKENTETFRMCYNYEIQFFCCEKYNCPSTTLTSTNSMSNSSPTSTTPRTTTSRSTHFPPPSSSTRIKSTKTVPTTSIPKTSSNSQTTKTMNPPSSGTAPLSSTTATSIVTSSQSLGTFNSHLTKVIKTTASTITNSLETTKNNHSTSDHTSSSTTVTVPSSTPCEECHWSNWIDVNHPISDSNGGDVENFETAEASGIKVCSDKKFIAKTQCRSTLYPNTPIEELGQKVTCNKETGLICRNKENTETFRMCYNYEIRFFCCEKYNCPSTTLTSTNSMSNSSPTSTTPRTTTSRSTHFPPPSSSTRIESTKTVPTTSIPKTSSDSQTTKTINPPSSGTAPLSSTTATSIVTSSQSLGTFNSHLTKVIKTTASTITNSLETTKNNHSTSDHTSSSTTVTVPSSTPCEECHWSNWIDVNHPISDSNGGDVENFETAEASGIKVCSDKKFIAKTQCRSTLYPNTPIEELGQKVTCNKETGLICRNKENTETFRMCYNYEIRFFCCEKYNCPSTTLTSTNSMSNSSPTSTTPRTTTSRSTHFPPPSSSTRIESTKTVPTTSIPKTSSDSQTTKTINPPSSGTAPLSSTTATSIVTSSQSLGTFNSHLTKVIKTTASTITNSLETTKNNHSTSAHTSSSTTVTVPSSTPCEECHWSHWIDVNHPISDSNGGDVENFETAEASGIKVCSDKKFIAKTQCRSTLYPNTPIEELGQKVTCNKETGLICRNKENTETFRMCYNYEIRFFCCEKYNCPSTTLTSTNSMSNSSPTSTTPRTTTSRSTHFPPPSSSTRIESTKTVPTTSIPKSISNSQTTKTMNPPSSGTAPLSSTTATSIVTSSQSLGTFNSHLTKVIKTTASTITNSLETTKNNHSTTDHTSSSTTVTVPSSTPCEECHWSQWIDVNHPISDSNGGDVENFETAEAAGIKVCSHKKFIAKTQCRSTLYPNTPIEELGQKVTCNKETGLICRNKENTETFRMCYNYEIRFFCCEKYNCPSTTLTSTNSMSNSSPTSTTPRTTTSRSTHFPPPSSSTRIESTKTVPTTSIPKTSSNSQTTKTMNPPSSGTAPLSSTTATSIVTSSQSLGTFKSHSTKVIKTITSTTENSTETTKSNHSTSEHTSSSTTVTVSSSTLCEECLWSNWIDVNHPTSDSNGGDVENFETAEAAGIKVCSDKKFITKIQCRSTSYPNFPIEELGQKVTCNKETGLICRNKENPGKFSMCYNYEIHFLCCEKYNCPSTTLTSTNSMPNSSPTSTSPRTTTKVTTWNSRTPTFSSRSTHFSLPSLSTTIESTKTVQTTLIPNTSFKFGTAETIGPHSTGIPQLSSTSDTLVTSSQSQGTLNDHSTTVIKSIASTTNNSPETTNSTHSTSDHTSSSTTVTTSPSTPCEECHWSDWIDVNHPTSDRNGGDVENFETAEAAGIKVCSDKKFITKVQCRSTSYPNFPIDELGQKVTCNKETGLICRNKENPGKFSMCYNYEIHFLCCEKYNCPSTTLTSTNSMPNSSPTSTSPRTTTKVTTWNSRTPTFSSRSTHFSLPSLSTTIESTKTVPSTSIQNTNSQTNKTMNPPSSGTAPLSSTTAASIETSSQSLGTFNSHSTKVIETTPSATTIKPETTKSKHSTLEHTTINTPPSTATERPNFCVHDGSTYKVGSHVPKDPESCQECICTLVNDSAVVICKEIVCISYCPPGYSYTAVTGQCCGRCVQTVCFLNTTELTMDDSFKDLPEQCCVNCDQDVCSLNSTLLIKPEKQWRPPNDNCTSYDCDPATLQIVKRVMSCPVQRPLQCAQGILVNFTSADGCCTIQYCEPRKCDVMKSWEVIESEGCTANVTLTNCGGYCNSFSRHPSFPKMVEHDCTCCQPTNTTPKKIHLLCKDGRKTAYSYTDVLQCACRGAACVFTE